MSKNSRAFTIIELLVVVSIIALLVGILLPAIGKARDQAKLTQSQGNIKNLGTAVSTYGAEYADRQLTYCPDNIAAYGQGDAAQAGYFNATHSAIPNVIFGHGVVSAANPAFTTWGYYSYGGGGSGVNFIWCFLPADVSTTDPSINKFGTFRIIQARNFNSYLNGKFYDNIFYAPKDTAVVDTVDWVCNNATEYTTGSLAWPGTPSVPRWSSYCMSPAAMVNPDVFGINPTTNAYYNNPWSMAAGFRSPALSQAAYPDLKTNIIEHHWLQNRRRVCAPAFGSGGSYNGCQPYIFNGSRESAPVTLYYDGHIGNRGQRDSIDGDARVSVQTQGQPGGSHGLWTRATAWGGAAGAANPTDGYFQSAAIDTTNTSYHCLTVDGIKGRDFLSK